MEARTEQVQRFLAYYDAIRSDKQAPVSRRDLDLEFLAKQFDTFFVLSRKVDDLGIDYLAPRLAKRYGLTETEGPLRDILPHGMAKDLDAIFDEMVQYPDRGVLASFATTGAATVEEHELVMLPVIGNGPVSARGVSKRVVVPTAEEVPEVAGPGSAASLRLQQKICFDLRAPLPPRGSGMLVRCLAAMAKFIRRGS